MNGWGAPLVMALVIVVAVGGAHALHRATSVAPTTLFTAPYLSGGDPREHAVSRYHARWYAVALIFLAFDVEMLFMYPWALVAADIGTSAIVEMFVFLGLLSLGVLYAWREGALQWA